MKTVDYAHIREDGTLQTVREHAEGTAAYAQKFADVFESAAEGRYLGMMHDIGKCSDAFQERLLNNGVKVDHSTAGAKIAMKAKDPVAAFAIAGHHSGIPDGGSRMDMEGGTLYGRLGKEVPDYHRYQNEIDPVPAASYPEWVKKGNPGYRNFQLSFYTRMLYSCLVDADFLDTECFMSAGMIDRGLNESMQVLADRLDSYITSHGWDQPKNELNAVRCHILQTCKAGGKKDQGIYTLTIPTGGGKTAASLAFALNHASEHHLSRVIYVIPYTSIIDQNAAVFKDILGEECVLEHHSGIDYESSEDDVSSLAVKRKLATENWDASVIVTTAVQFFESLFANSASKCRKLHNIANSVIIFDEAQMLPVNYLQPYIAAISQLYEHYHCSIVLCTATQPSLNRIFSQYIEKLQIHELCPLSEKETSVFKRVTYQLDGDADEDGIADRMSSCNQVLCIVNTRKTAQNVFRSLPEEGRYHLSTLMTPHDRKEVLKIICNRLKQGLVCRVVSTSLIEAGVDVDFPVVYREIAGLDSIVQAAGRCNREGKRERENSCVHVFRLGNTPKMIRENTSACEQALRFAVNNEYEPDYPACIHEYFQTLYTWKGDGLDAKNIMKEINEGIQGCQLPFKQIAEKFQLIDQNTQTLYIPEVGTEELFMELRTKQYSRGLFRKLGQYSVSVYEYQLKELMELGLAEKLDDGIFVLRDQSVYDPGTGLENKVKLGNSMFG